MIKTFVKDPIKVQAVQYTGDNYDEISNFAEEMIFRHDGKDVIKTRIGYRYIQKGDWIIRKNTGEYRLCRPYIFENAYEELR